MNRKSIIPFQRNQLPHFVVEVGDERAGEGADPSLQEYVASTEVGPAREYLLKGEREIKR